MADAQEGPAAVLTAYLAAGDRGDWSQLERWLAEDVVTHSPGGTTSLGAAAQKAAWAAAREGLQDLKHEIQTLMVEGQLAAARVVVTGTHTGSFLGIPATGAALRVDQAVFVRVVSGRLAEIWEVVDTGTGLQQLGVLGGQSLSPSE